MRLNLQGIETVVPMFSDPLIIRRVPPGVYDEHGVYQEQAPEEIEICASVQTATDKDLEKVPEGRRLRGGIRIYTTSELLTGSVQDRTQPDIVLWNGAEWQVEKIDNWNDYAEYYKAIATRVGQ